MLLFSFPGAKIFRLHLHWCVHIWNGDQGIIDLHIKITVAYTYKYVGTLTLDIIKGKHSTSLPSLTFPEYVFYLDDWPRAASPPWFLLQRPVEYSGLYCGQRCPGGFCLLVSTRFFSDLPEQQLKGENPVCQLQSSKKHWAETDENKIWLLPLQRLVRDGAVE